MPLEALLWIAVAVLAVPLTKIVRQPLEKLLQDWAEPAAALGPWLHGLAPAYLALITGAILSRDAGLRGHTPLGWIGGGLSCAIVVALLGTRTRLRSAFTPWPDPLRAVADEPRWALYRAAGALWTRSHPIGTGIGLGFSLLEWALIYRPWGEDTRRHPDVCATLIRIASSTIFFALTRNFWLTMLSQGALMALFGNVPRLEPTTTASGRSPEN